MARREQLDLLNWSPPQPVARFDDDKVRAVSVAGRMCRAVSVRRSRKTCSTRTPARRAKSM
jgi:hypothetical protein